jgi:hypothetical protein
MTSLTSLTSLFAKKPMFLWVLLARLRQKRNLAVTSPNLANLAANLATPL